MYKRCTNYSFFLVILFLLNIEKMYAQTCGSVAATDIATSPATCPGGGAITAPTLASGTVYQLTGGDITGIRSQNSPVFGNLSAGNYNVTFLCAGVPNQTFPVSVANAHSPLTLDLTGSLFCANSGTIAATAGAGYNMGGTGVIYQYAMWSSSDGGQNRADEDLTYASTASWSSLTAGTYYVRVKDNCGTFTTRRIDLESSRPAAKPFMGNPVVVCSGGNFSLTFPNAKLFRDPSGADLPGDPYSAPLYQYRVEKVSPGGVCESATLLSTVTGNTPISSSTTLSSISLADVTPGERYRLVVTSPCGEQVATCIDVQDYVVLELKPSRICAPVGGDDVRLIVNYYASNDAYTLQLPVNVNISSGGSVIRTITANTPAELYAMTTNVPATAFPLTVTAVDACGITRTINYNSIPTGTTPSNVTFYYRHSCVQANGNVRVSTYTVGNWYGMEYNTGTDAEKTKYELVNSATMAVVSTVYGLFNPYANEIVFPEVPAGATYFVRVTPPAGSGSACSTPQESNTVTIPASQGLIFNVSPTVERICNNGLNNIKYNASINFGSLLYALYSGTSATGTPISTAADPVNLPAGDYYYVVTRDASGSCTPATREGQITITPFQTTPTITRTLSVTCQQLGSGPQTTGTAFLTFNGNGPFRVERSTNGGPFVEVDDDAVDSFTEASLVLGDVYNYRITDQCGTSVSQQVTLKPLSPTIIENQLEPCIGQPFTLTAIDFGDPSTTYSWEKVGTPGELSDEREYTFPAPFSAADNGTYKLTITLLDGCVVREAFVTLNSDNCGEEFASGSIGDKVWFDNNSNGIQDATELGAAGVPVSLQGYVGPASPSATDLANDANWTDIPGASTVTDSDGEYLFDGLDTGYYRVKFGTVPNYGLTTPNQGSDDALDSDAGAGGFSQAVYINALGLDIAKDNPTVDAGLVPVGSIGDYVWLDDDQNGKQDAIELPKSGVTVRLYVKNGSAWDLVETQVTDNDGKYLFSGLPTGTYQVEFVLPANHVFTYVDKAGVADEEDSDADMATGKTGEITIDSSEPETSVLRNNMTIDAGLIEGGMPVKLSMFDVKKGENVSAILRWTTTEEVNSEKFEIQRSADAKSWNAIGQVGAKVNSEGVVNYRFDDMQPNLGSNYYRLKMIDLDGTFAYSIIRKLSGEVGAEVTIYPNPVSNELSVLSTNGQAIGKVEVINQNGKVLLTRNGSSIAAPINVKNLPAGIYLVKISFQNGTIENRKVVIVR
jgi:hypothetical protein